MSSKNYFFQGGGLGLPDLGALKELLTSSLSALTSAAAVTANSSSQLTGIVSKSYLFHPNNVEHPLRYLMLNLS
jgi:hypothetical protein